MTTFYKSEKVTDSITAIRSMTGEIMYLIEGQERALLMDTCLGVGNLRKFVETLTDKPYDVVLSHGHIDHAMGAPEFDHVYMNHKDTDVYLSMREVEGRMGYIQANLGGNLPEFEEEEIIQPAEMDFDDLTDGMIFDLGGLHVEAYALPGHTPGTMVFLVVEEQILILGDACNTATFLFDENSLTVEEYKENLLALKSRMEGRYDRIFLCHHDMEVPADLMSTVIEVCDEIMEGNTDDLPFDFMGGHYYIAKTIGEGFVRPDGKFGNIIYNKNKIWKAK